VACASSAEKQEKTMPRVSIARRPAPIVIEEPEGLTFGAMKAAAEVYWPGLGGKVADEWREYNRDLFDNKVRPAAMVLSRMSSVNGHWFPLLDRADQRIGTEGHMVMHAGFYAPPDRVLFVRRADLLRGMMHQLRRQDGLPLLKGNSREWCDLVMELHRRLTGQRIWCAPENEIAEPRKQLAGGLYEPEQTILVQDADPETGAPSLPRDKIVGWPGTVMDLGRLTRD
jgi:hypothetical protein